MSRSGPPSPFSPLLKVFTLGYGLSAPERRLFLTPALHTLINVAGVRPGIHVAKVSLASG